MKRILSEFRAQPSVFGVALFVFTLTMVAVYGFGVVTPFGMSDDYWQLVVERKAAGESPWSRLVDSARAGVPAGRLIGYVASRLAWTILQPKTVADLGLLRVVSIASMVLLALTVFVTFRRQGVRDEAAGSAALVVCLTPPFAAWLGWAGFMFVPLAAGVAFAAGARSIEAEQLPSSAGRQLAWAGSIFGFWFGANFYQPAAGFFWAGLALALFFNPAPFRSFVRRTVFGFSAGAIGLLSAYLTLKAGARVTGLISERTSLATNISAKLHWFVTDVLVSSLNFTTIKPSLVMAVFVSLVIVLGLLTDERFDLKTRIARLMVALALLPASYAPNLVVAEMWATYRSQAPMTTLIVVLTIAALSSLMHRLERRAGRLSGQLVTFALALVVAGFALTAGARYIRYVAMPEVIEQGVMATELARFEPSIHTKVIVRRPVWWVDSVTELVRLDEFGYPNATPDWGATALARLILGDQLAPASVTSTGGEDVIIQAQDTLVVDMRQLRHFRFW